MKTLLPIVFIVLALTAAITYSLAKKALPKIPADNIGISANQLENIVSPKIKFDTEDVVTPTPAKFVITPTVTPTASPTATPKQDLPETAEGDTGVKTTKGGVASATKTVKTTICTPVYGMANTCTEHVVVDTGAADSILFNMAGISYIGGLVAFIKAKAKK